MIKNIVPLTICIDATRRALVIVLPCYGALEIVGVITIIIIMKLVTHDKCRKNTMRIVHVKAELLGHTSTHSQR